MKSETKVPEFTDSLEWGRWFEPKFGDRVDRPIGGGKRFYVLFRDKQSNRVLRSVTIQLEDKEFKLRPNEYLNYPVSYTAYMAKNFLLTPDYRLIRDVRNQPYSQQPYYYTANAGVLLVIGGVFVLGTTGGFIVGLAKGTYELTDDIWEGFALSGREVVLDYNDYSYDENGKLIQVSSYLPYRAITKSVIPVYDREGKKEVTSFYPSDNPSLLFEIRYRYRNRSEVPNSVMYKEFIPKENKKIIQLPLVK